MRRVLALCCLLALLAGPKVAQAAKYPTYHINELTLTPYKISTTNSITQYINADPGKKYVVIMFHEVNRDDVPQAASSSDFKLSSNGQVVGTGYEDPTPKLDSVVLLPGARQDGGIAFQVDSHAHSGLLAWHVDAPLFSSETWPTYVWKLTF